MQAAPLLPGNLPVKSDIELRDAFKETTGDRRFQGDLPEILHGAQGLQRHIQPDQNNRRAGGQDDFSRLRVMEDIGLRMGGDIAGAINRSAHDDNFLNIGGEFRVKLKSPLQYWSAGKRRR